MKRKKQPYKTTINQQPPQQKLTTTIDYRRSDAASADPIGFLSEALLGGWNWAVRANTTTTSTTTKRTTAAVATTTNNNNDNYVNNNIVI